MKEEEILRQIRVLLHSIAPEAQVILYGSRARGNAREDSDWDILILIDGERIEQEDFDKIAYPLIEFGWTIGEMISPKLYTFNDWKRRYFTPFYKNVEHDGINLL